MSPLTPESFGTPDPALKVDAELDAAIDKINSLNEKSRAVVTMLLAMRVIDDLKISKEEKASLKLHAATALWYEAAGSVLELVCYNKKKDDFYPSEQLKVNAVFATLQYATWLDREKAILAAAFKD